MTLHIAPVGPCCSRCGRLVWRSRDAQLIDSGGQRICPAPRWARPLVANAHTTDRVSWLADFCLVAVRAAPNRSA